MAVTAYVGLGSNLGDKIQNLKNAVKEIEKIAKTQVTRQSSLYLTEPWGKQDQEEFVNQVIEISTQLTPRELLSWLQQIEIKMGRKRKEKWGPRIIDLDILLYGDQVKEEEDLRIPHPYMRQRLFVLIPLQEINPTVVFPDDKGTIEEVLVRVFARDGNQGIKRI
ncbi:MAG: 2-amino-4-hydroxy-6-hydroxymethyldihydropteridine diphosphokinase [Syntrophomonadaceae bacterium]